MIRLLTVLISGILLCVSTVAASQESDSQEPLIITVRQGKLGAGGRNQAYQVMSGESFFIPIGDVGTRPPPGVQAPTAQEIRSAQVAQQIQAKVTELQKKKYELDTELYMVQRPPLEIERQDLERELHLLEQEQEKLDSQRTVTETREKSVAARAAGFPPTSVQGVTVKPTLLDNNAVQLQFSAGPSQSTANTTLGGWVQIPGVQPETWVRVNRK